MPHWHSDACSGKFLRIGLRQVYYKCCKYIKTQYCSLFPTQYFCPGITFLAAGIKVSTWEGCLEPSFSWPFNHRSGPRSSWRDGATADHSTYVIPLDEAFTFGQVFLHLRGCQDGSQHRHFDGNVLPRALFDSCFLSVPKFSSSHSAAAACLFRNQICFTGWMKH